MNLREWLNQNQALGTIAAVILLLGGGWFVMDRIQGKDSASPRNLYYLDLNTQSLLVASERLSSPIETPSGPLADGSEAGVQAMIYACGSCPGDLTGKSLDEVETSGAFVGYLIKLTEEGKRRTLEVWEGGEVGMDVAYGAGRHTLVAHADASSWHPLASEAGQQIEMSVRRRCDPGTAAVQCLP